MSLAAHLVRLLSPSWAAFDMGPLFPWMDTWIRKDENFVQGKPAIFVWKTPHFIIIAAKIPYVVLTYRPPLATFFPVFDARVLQSCLLTDSIQTFSFFFVSAAFATSSLLIVLSRYCYCALAFVRYFFHAVAFSLSTCALPYHICVANSTPTLMDVLPI